MRRQVRTLAVATTLLALGGCGSSPTDARDVSPSAQASSPSTQPVRSAAQLLRAAQRTMARENTGRYRFAAVASASGHELTIAIDEAAYDVAAKSFAIEREVPNIEAKPGEPPTFTARIRQVAGKNAYMQMPQWRGPWHGCWLGMTQSTIDEYLPKGSASLAAGMPMPVVVALTADRAKATGDDRHVAAVTEGALGLQLLGVSLNQILALGLDKEADKVRVPISVEIIDGHIQTILAYGPGAKRAFADAKVSLGTIGASLGALKSETSFRPAGMLSITAPAPAKLLPADADKSDTCPANR